VNFILDTSVISELVQRGPTSMSLNGSRRPISAIDALLAATAQQWGFTLVTRNTVHFQDTGINLLNPWG
jgi:predicted nucleic acid-binding protein